MLYIYIYIYTFQIKEYQFLIYPKPHLAFVHEKLKLQSYNDAEILHLRDKHDITLFALFTIIRTVSGLAKL